jgi:hypothetical protein
MENSLADTGFSNENGKVTHGIPDSPGDSSETSDRSSADIAAELYIRDPAWKARFEARLDNAKAALRAEAEEMIREGQEKLAALTGGHDDAPPLVRGKLKPIKKAAPKPKAAAKPKAPKQAANPVALAHDGSTALRAIEAAGKEGLGTVRLGKLLGTAPGPIVAPLIEAGKVKRKGEKRGTVYFAV